MAIICICRGTNSGGRALADCLAPRLGYPVLGREVLQMAAAQLGVPAQLLEQRMGDRPSRWHRFSSERRTYIVAVQSCLAEHAVAGNLVYHGLAGSLLLHGVPCTFCIRLIAPLAQRVEAVMAETGMDAAMAEQYIRDVDESRARWVRVMYGEDIMDPALYDAVVNLETITIDGACALVARAVDQPELAVTDAVRTRLEEFRLGCAVQLHLAADPDLRSLELEAMATGGAVTVSGRVPLRKSGETSERIVGIARSVAGVESVRLNVDWYDPYP